MTHCWPTCATFEKKYDRPDLHYDHTVTKRALIAVAWLVGTTVPLLVATVLVMGCCVLPFHNVIHKVFPICHIAMGLMRGDQADDTHNDTTPAREKEQPVRRLITELTSFSRFTPAAVGARAIAPTAAISYRSFISLGAIRCDRDVGLHLLVVTFLI
jgi:hypothetical protein